MTSEPLKEHDSQIEAEQERERREARRDQGRDQPFRFAERCLYEYQENLARLEVLREDLSRLSSVKVQDYNPDIHSGGDISDPVLSYVQKVELLEGKIAGLERRTSPITRLLTDLEAPYVLDSSPRAGMARLLRMFYIGRNPIEIIAHKLGLGERQVRRKRRDLVYLAMKYLGLV